MRHQFRILFGLVCCVLLLGCEQPQGGIVGGDADKETKDTNSHGDEIMAGNSKAEAREWLKDAETHVLFKANRKKLAGYIDEFYAAGTKQVLIADIEEHEGKQYGNALLVVLPDDQAARAKLFKLNETVGAAYDEDPVSDSGQKYIYITLD